MFRLIRYKISIIFIIFILFLSISVIFSTNTIAFNDTNNTDTPNPDDNPFYIELKPEEHPYKKRNHTGIPANYQIMYTSTNIKVITPEGSRIIGVSNNDIGIIIQNRPCIIRYNQTISKFCPVNFKSSIEGTRDYKINVYYNYKYYKENSLDYYKNYTIEWGNGATYQGKGNIPDITSYQYKKQGEYPVSITLIDRNGVKYIYQKNITYQLSTDQYIKLWTVENKETVAAGSAGTIGLLSLIGIALTETGKYKLLALLLLSIPMFTKIHKEDVLDHFVRGQIYGYIKAYPGAYYNQIMRELDIKNGTLSYHLYILEKTGTIKSRKEGYRFRAFYPTDIKFPEKERYRLTELQINIIKLIQDNKGINQKNIAKNLNENHQTISYNIKVLNQAGIINTSKKGRKTLCFMNQKLSDNLPLKT